MKTSLQKLTKVLLIVTLSIWTTKAQNIYTFAGTGAIGFSGDGGAANLAQLSSPAETAVDASGNVYIADLNNNRIRKVNPSGIISTLAGTGIAGFSGDGAAANLAQLNNPRGVAVDASGNIYFADYGNNRIRKINTSGVISTFAGTGVAGFSGDGGPATSAQLNQPFEVAVDASGNVYITDYFNQRIRKVNTSGIISTFAGGGGSLGDGGSATNASFYNPRGMAIDASGNVYIADFLNYRVRKVNTSGIISTFAGTGIAGFSGDGGLATNSQLDLPRGVAVDVSGNVYIADLNNNRIRKVNTSGIISTFAGTGIAGFNGDGGVATNAQLNNPTGLAVDAFNNIYIADGGNNRVREICAGSCLLNINSFTENISKILIFPNPNLGFFKLQIDNEISKGKLILINSLGQKVCEQSVFEGTNNISADALSKGLYHYVLLQNNVPTDSGNVTIE